MDFKLSFRQPYYFSIHSLRIFQQLSWSRASSFDVTLLHSMLSLRCSFLKHKSDQFAPTPHYTSPFIILQWCIIALKFKFKVLSMSPSSSAALLPALLFIPKKQQTTRSPIYLFALAHSVPCYLDYPSLSCSFGQFPFILKSLVRCHPFCVVFPDTPHMTIEPTAPSLYNLPHISLCHGCTRPTIIIGCSVAVFSARTRQCLILLCTPGAQHSISVQLAYVSQGSVQGACWRLSLTFPQKSAMQSTQLRGFCSYSPMGEILALYFQVCQSHCKAI